MGVYQNKYSPEKVERLRTALSTQAEYGQSQDFEIHVDGMKVVPRTDDLEHFDSYQALVDGETRSMVFILYLGNSNRYNKHIFHMKEEDMKASMALNGPLSAADIDVKLAKAREEWTQEQELQRSKNEMSELKSKLKEKEKYILELENTIQDMDQNKWNVGNLNVAEFGSLLVEGFVRRNPQILTKLPGGEALAGAIEADNLEQQQEQNTVQSEPEYEETEAAFTPSGGAGLNEEEQTALTIVKRVFAAFPDERAGIVLNILEQLASQPEKLQSTLDFITSKSK